ncbi:MAG: protein NosL [Proteobacteria bacterium]|nr:MAG: protein NosL [Pseudomonadota bacterium]
MKRAHLLAAAIAALLGALACSEPTSGPARVVFGRHACDQCAMAISDPRYAAQIRTGPRDVARFDDFGCAVLWLEAHGGLEAAQEIWAMDSQSSDAQRESWLDARRAHFRSDQRTPMAYGWAAVARAGPDTADFDAARRAILEHQRERDAHGR